MRSVVVLLALTILPAPARAGEAVDFERHVIGLLGKSGCSAGACH